MHRVWWILAIAYICVTTTQNKTEHFILPENSFTLLSCHFPSPAPGGHILISISVIGLPVLDSMWRRYAFHGIWLLSLGMFGDSSMLLHVSVSQCTFNSDPLRSRYITCWPYFLTVSVGCSLVALWDLHSVHAKCPLAREEIRIGCRRKAKRKTKVIRDGPH